MTWDPGCDYRWIKNTAGVLRFDTFGRPIDTDNFWPSVCEARIDYLAARHLDLVTRQAQAVAAVQRLRHFLDETPLTEAAETNTQTPGALEQLGEQRIARDAQTREAALRGLGVEIADRDVDRLLGRHGG